MRLLIPLLLLTACDVEPDDFLSADEALLGRQAPSVRGCGDATVAASNFADTRAIFVNVNGIAAAAAAAGQPIRLTVTLPDPNVSVVARAGQRVMSATCVGAYPIPGPRVTAELPAVSGTFTVTAFPTGGPAGMPEADLDIEIVALVLARPDGTVVRAGNLEIYGVSVGLYPP